MRHKSLLYFLKVAITPLILAIISLVPILKTYGLLNISYDTFIPLIPENSFNMTYELLESGNGIYISNSYIFWVWIVYALKQLVSNIYQTAFLYQFLIFFLSGYGMYNIYNLFNSRNKFFGLLPAIFFIYSPHLFDHMLYYQGTVPIVWITYFFIKFVKNKTFTVLDVLFISVLLGLIVDLPNPKYHFLLVVEFVIIVFVSLLLRLLTYRDLIHNIKYLVLLVACTTYISVPFIYYGVTYLKSAKEANVTINTRKNYEEYGETLDYGVANIHKMITLFHAPSVDEKTSRLIKSPLFILVYYTFPILVLGLIIKLLPNFELTQKKYSVVLLTLSLTFIFLSKSSNPPFGFIYDKVLESTQFFAFMRTTAGFIIYTAIFYSVLLGIVIQHLVEKTFLKSYSIIFAFILIFIAGYPMWSGGYYLRRTGTGALQYGIRVPSDYFTSANYIKSLKLDTKLNIYPHAVGYQSNTWGYFGFIIYPWIYDKPIIALDKSLPEGKIQSFTNARYIIWDKTIKEESDTKHDFEKANSTVFQSEILNIYRKGDSDTLPHFYTPTTYNLSDDILASIKKRGITPDIAYYSKRDFPKLDLKFTQPSIEYKKINPTKYRIRVHRASGIFNLLFNDNFDHGWKLYSGENFILDKRLNEQKWDKQKDKYLVTNSNVFDQSSREAVSELIRSGEITTIGTSENEPIKFISKKFLNTVQNDNLQADHFYETFTKSELTNELQHAKVNTFANSWIIDTNVLCKNSNANCVINPDGSYDFELVLEFWPQRLKNMMYVLSLTSAVTSIFIAFFIKIFNHSKKSNRII